MPSYVGSKEVSKRYVGFREVIKVYQGSDEVWNADSPVIYGWHVDPSESDPSQAVTYLADAVGKTPAAMGSSTFSYGDWADAFFMPKPCMLRYDGTVDYYLDPNDYTKKADGTASDIADPNYGGNAMMEWPLIWYKFVAGATDGEGFFYCSNRKVDSSYKCWCNVNSQNKVTNHFYTAIYNGTGTMKLRSLSDVQINSINGNGETTFLQETKRSLANNIGPSIEWFTDIWADHLLINSLLILVSKSLNSQKAFGNGIVTGSQSAKDSYTTGTLNQRGLFYGSTSNNTTAVKVFGMENWWGCVASRVAGCIGTTDGKYAVKFTYGTADGSSAEGYNTSGNGYINIGSRPIPNNNIRSMHFSEYGYVPIQTSNDNNTDYYCDGYANSPDSGVTPLLLIGGSAWEKSYAGINRFNFNAGHDYGSWSISTRLSCKPILQSN